MTEENELKVHYQNLKAKCLEMGLAFYPPTGTDDEDEEQVVVLAAKRFYNEITGQEWKGPDVAGA